MTRQNLELLAGRTTWRNWTYQVYATETQNKHQIVNTQSNRHKDGNPHCFSPGSLQDPKPSASPDAPGGGCRHVHAGHILWSFTVLQLMFCWDHLSIFSSELWTEEHLLVMLIRRFLAGSPYSSTGLRQSADYFLNSSISLWNNGVKLLFHKRQDGSLNYF